MVKISGVFTPVMVLRAVLKAYISPGAFWSRSRGMSNTFFTNKISNVYKLFAQQ